MREQSMKSALYYVIFFPMRENLVQWQRRNKFHTCQRALVQV